MTAKEAGFVAQLARYKAAIDDDIATYAAHVRRVTKEQYGEYPSFVTNTYLDLLARGGKRVRGALVMTGYEMLGGKNKQMITRAATAMEMLHAAMLIIDDIQDHDVTRRGRPAVHVALTNYAERLGLKAEPAATGVSLALDASLTGSHAAQMLLAGLSAADDLKIKVIGIVNHTVVMTLHGQTYDIINAGLAHPKPEDLARATEWKSAHYTFLNPLCVGMVLAGAGCEDTDAIRDYAINTGIAFQLADDIMDGDVPTTEVIATRGRAEAHVEQALHNLEQNRRDWQQTSVDFLRDLAQFVTTRKN